MISIKICYLIINVLTKKKIQIKQSMTIWDINAIIKVIFEGQVPSNSIN